MNNKKKEELEGNISIVLIILMLAITLALVIKFDKTTEIYESHLAEVTTTTVTDESTVSTTSKSKGKTTVQNIITDSTETEESNTTAITTTVITTEESKPKDNINVVEAASQENFILQEELPSTEDNYIQPEENESSNETVNVIIPEEPKDNAFYFYRDSMRVHTADCIYTDKDSMERIEGDYIEKARPCTCCNPSIHIGELYIPEEEHKQTHSELSGIFTEDNVITEMTYYKGDSYYCCGARGTILTNNYSCASNYYPFGTILYIQSEDGSVNGYYEVEDTGGMANNVVDIYYNDYSLTPYSFTQLGRVPVQVWVVT